jgi:hypothetical protein
MTAFTDIQFDPLLPWQILLPMMVLAAALLALAFWRRSGAAGWRALALTVGFLALLNPSVIEEQRRPLQDVALVIADRSPSQKIRERDELTEEAITKLEQRLSGDKSLELRVVRSEGRGFGPEQTPDGTHLIEAMEQAVAEVPTGRLAGVILLSDGQVHDLPGEASQADPGAPVHLLLTGRRDERDRRIDIIKSPSYGLVGGEVTLEIALQDPGAEGEVARLQMTQDNGLPRMLNARIGTPLRIPLTLDHAGPTVVEISTPALEDELTTLNNRIAVMINGVRERLRVLLVSGEPHAGERMWRNILKSDPSVDLVHFTILRPPHKQDGTPIRELSLIAFPTRELFQIKLSEFDLVIFDRYRRRGVLPDAYLRNVTRYVQLGGAVLVAAGPSFAGPLSLNKTPLREVLPSRPTGQVQVAGFRPSLTTSGHRHPVTSGLPGAGDGQSDPKWGRWFRLIDVDTPRGDVLLQGPAERPLLILNRVGEGRVAQLLSDHAWLWARGFEGGGPQAEMLRRVAHWLMKEPDLEEEDLRAQLRDDRLQIVRRSLSRDNQAVTVTSPSGETITVELKEDSQGRETGSIPAGEPGLYRLADGRHEAVAAVGVINPLEYADMRATTEKLKPLLELTGGGSYWLSDRVPDVRRVKPGRASTGQSWLGLRANRQFQVTGVAQFPLLPAILVLLLFVGVSMWAWRREGD